MYGALSTTTSADQRPYLIRLNDRGYIEVIAHGFWSADQATRYWHDLTALIVRTREQQQRVRVLVDKRGTPVQSAVVTEILQAGSQKSYREEDRVAMVLDSSLRKLQARRLYPSDRIKAFMSYDAALSWLLAA